MLSNDEVTVHYHADSANPAWIREMVAIETEAVPAEPVAEVA